MISVILSIIWWLFDLQEVDLAILKSRSLPFFVGGRMCSGLSINDLSALTNGKNGSHVLLYNPRHRTSAAAATKKKKKKHHHQRHQLPAQQGTESLVE